MCCDGNQNDTQLQSRKRKYLIGSIIAAILFAITGLTWYLNLPSIQNKIGGYLAEMLSDELGTEVRLESVRFSFPNSFTLQGIQVKDQKGRQMLYASGLAVSISIPEILLYKKIDVSSASLTEPRLLVVQEEDSTYNFQFVIDSLSSSAPGAGGDVSLSKCSVRSLTVSYQSIPGKTKASMLKSDILLSDITIAGQSVSCRIPAFSYGKFTLKSKELDLVSEPFSMNGVLVFRKESDRFTCQTEGTSFRIGDRTFDDTGFDLSLKDDIMTVSFADIHSDGFLTIKGKGAIDLSTGSVDTEAKDITVTPKFVEFITRYVSIDEEVIERISRLGDISYSGTFSKTGSAASKEFISAIGTITTDLGQLSSDLRYSAGTIDAKVSTSGFSYGQLISDNISGQVSVYADLYINPSDLYASANRIHADIPRFEYQGQSYSDIALDLSVDGKTFEGLFRMDDPSSQVDSRFSFITDARNPRDIRDINLSLDLNASKDAYSQFLGNDSPKNISLSLEARLSDTDIQSATGQIDIHSASVTSSKATYSINDANITINPTTDDERLIIIDTDFLKASLSGRIDPLTIHESFLSQLGNCLPSLGISEYDNDNDFTFDIKLRQTDFLSQFVPDSALHFQPIDITGDIDTPGGTMNMSITTPMFRNSSLSFSSVNADISSGHESLSARIVGRKDSEESNDIDLSLKAELRDDGVISTIDFSTTDSQTLKGSLLTDARLSRDKGKLTSNIQFRPSWISFKNDRWDIKPSYVSLSDSAFHFRNVELHSADRFLILDGYLSESEEDTLYADFKGFDIAYLQDILNFHPVKFGGKMSGQATLSQLFDRPNVQAHINIDSLLFQTGYLGAADINVGWDPAIKGVSISADIIDDASGTLPTGSWPLRRATTVRGYVAPGEVRDDIQLTITADNTSATFIHGFLGGVFRSVSGEVNGVMRITTGTDGVNLIGDMSVDADLRLRATDMTYHVDGRDLIHFVPNAFKFQNVHIADRNGHQGVVNGQLTHRKLRGLGYDFNIDFQDLLVYDEKEFNSDKFLATVSGSGNMTVRGKDGYGVSLAANITPSKGSVFAYDAATPYSIDKGQFITFRSRDELRDQSAAGTDETREKQQEKDDYSSDVVFDINMHVTPDCAIKLRMDNNEDGYITAYGYGDIVGRYHNKNPFTLQGIYQIQSGKYRLFLQDMIYRDLLLQPGSNVVFNGFPFDAGIHLICHHTLSSVPLRDLTTSVEFVQNSNVKVVCVMDITGKLGNMNFGFDIDLPNVSDETRQMVRSLISTEEEMSMQMIYLLGLGRFYTNEIARAQGKTGTGSEMSSLVSSTLSGQINNMLDSFMGEKSNWNIGTGLSTGEKGWDNIDVEGSLSGRLLDDRLLINGNFGYRDNSLTNKSNFIGDFDIKYRLHPNHNIYIKGYNQTNDKYFTKSTLTTQGIGLSIQKDFDSFLDLFRKSATSPKSLSELRWPTEKPHKE